MHLIRKFIAAISLSILATSAAAGVDTSTDANDVILAGHDAVAYFKLNRPVLGSAEYTAGYNGAVYRFTSKENRDVFKADPAKYAPAYGGYCSFGTSIGKKFAVDGQSFKVVEGRLYVNKNLSVGEHWAKDIPGRIVLAEGNWAGIEHVDAKQL